MKFREMKQIQENDSCLPYSGIDLEKTGVHLKKLIERKGYTVKDIQSLLHLSCPQPVYRWFKGQVLPSVDHLYVLSKLLHVHMEELLQPIEVLASESVKRKFCFVSDIIIIKNGLLINTAACRKRRPLAIYWITVQKSIA